VFELLVYHAKLKTKQDMTKRMLHVTMSFGIIVSGVRQADTILSLLILIFRPQAREAREAREARKAREAKEAREAREEEAVA